MMRNIGVAAVAASLIFAGSALAQDRYPNQKVAYHINVPGGDGDKYYMQALGNVQNHINAVEPGKIEVHVVMHGDGLEMLRDAKKNLKLQGVISNLKNQKVVFAVCRNTLVGRKIDPDKDLFDVYKEDIVPSGVAELSRLQQRGFTYIKP
jgi:hypothetical protein